MKRATQSGYIIKDAFIAFLEEKKARGINKCTTDNYKISWDIFMKDNHLTPDSCLDEIDSHLYYSWVNKLQEQDLRLASINHYIADTKVFLNWCMRNDFMKQFKIEKVAGQEERIKYYSDNDIQILIKHPAKNASFTDWRTWVCVNMIMATGARASTLVNIKLEDVDFNDRQIFFRHLKNKHVINAPMSDGLYKVLKEYLREWKRDKPEGYLFCDGAEKQSTVSALRQALVRYCNDRGVEPKALHALRHSFARAWIVNGGNALKLQRVLTHTTLDMTKRYVRLFDDDLKADFSKFCPLDNLKNDKTYTVSKR